VELQAIVQPVEAQFDQGFAPSISMFASLAKVQLASKSKNKVSISQVHTKQHK
jgi:hypothetical protein